MTRNGFTLIELLVALALFALLSLAGVALLRSSIDTQIGVGAALDAAGGVERLHAILASELGGAQPRGWRDSGGQPQPAFVGTANAIAFVTAADNSPAATRLHRSEFALDAGALTIARSDRLDGVALSDGAPLVRNVASARFRFRSADGDWADIWTPPDAAALPRAVELTLERRGNAPVTMRFLVAPDGLRAAGPPA